MYEKAIDWDDIRLFLAVARTGGLSPASQQTGKSPATLMRRLREFEISTGQELFVRGARGYSLTEDGVAMLKRAESLEEAFFRVVPASVQLKRSIVRISAGSWMSRFLVLNLKRLVAPDDRIQLHFLSAEHRLDIAHRETLIGIRNARPQETALAAQRVAHMHFAPFAINASVDGWVGVSVNTPSARYVRDTFPNDIRIEANSPRLALDLAMAGAGRIMLPERIGAMEAGLQQVGERVEELSHEQWLVSHLEERHRKPVRETLDRIKALLRDG